MISDCDGTELATEGREEMEYAIENDGGGGSFSRGAAVERTCR